MRISAISEGLAKGAQVVSLFPARRTVPHFWFCRSAKEAGALQASKNKPASTTTFRSFTFEFQMCCTTNCKKPQQDGKHRGISLEFYENMTRNKPRARWKNNEKLS